MTRITGLDCAVMCNLIDTLAHTTSIIDPLIIITLGRTNESGPSNRVIG